MLRPSYGDILPGKNALCFCKFFVRVLPKRDQVSGKQILLCQNCLPCKNRDITTEVYPCAA